MINAFEVAATLKLHDLISPALLKIAEQLEKVESRIVKINSQLGVMKREGASLKTIGTEFKGIAASAKAMHENMSKASNSAIKLRERLNTVGVSGLDKATVGTHELADSLTRATSRAALLKGELRSIGASSMAAGAAGASGGYHRGRHGGFHGGTLHMGPHGVGMGQVGLATDDAMPMLFGGGMIGYGLSRGYKSAAELANAQAAFRTLNLNPSEEKEVFETARQLAGQIKGTTITGAIKTIHDLHTAFGDVHHALSAAPEFLKSEFVMKAMAGGDEHAAEGAAYSLAKAMEHRPGLMTDPARFQREIGMFMQTYMYTRGKFSPQQLFATQQTGKTAYGMMDADFLYGPFAAYASSKSGSTAGTAAMSALQALIGGTMQERAAGWLYQHGLWQMGGGAPASLVAAAKDNPALGTVVKQMQKSLRYNGGIVDSDLFIRNAYQWTMQHMLPAVEKDIGRKLDLSNPGDLLAFDQKVMKSGLARNVSGYIVDLVNESLRNEKETKGMRKNMTFDQARNMYLQNPVGAEIAAQASWKNFMTVIGTVYLPKVTDGLLKLSTQLDRLTKWAENNPVKVKIATDALIGLSAALLFGGTVKLLTSAFGGLAGALSFSGVGGVGGAVGIRAVAASLGMGGLAGAIIGIGAAVGLTIKGISAWRKYNDETMKHLRVPNSAAPDGFPKPISPDKSHPSNGKLGPWGQWIHDHLGGNAATKGGAPVKRFSKPYDPYANFGRAPLVNTGKNDKVSLNTTINIDGRKVAEVVSMHQARAASRPQSGASFFDGGMSQAPTGFA